MTPSRSPYRIPSYNYSFKRLQMIKEDARFTSAEQTKEELRRHLVAMRITRQIWAQGRYA